MDVKITCRACERAFPLAMALDRESKSGHCPFCGEVLAFQYGATFVTLGESLIGLGHEFVRQLTLFAELAGGFAIDVESVVGPVRTAVSTQDERLREPYRAGWPAHTDETVR